MVAKPAKKKPAGRVPAGKATGRVPARKATGRVPARKATGRVPAGKATGRVPAGKATGRVPTPAAVLKKVAAVSDSTKALQKEIRGMSKIFAENQKVLVSMKGMIDTLASTLEAIQKQSRQISILEEDAQKLHAGLSQVRSQSGMITKIGDQASKLEEEVARISRLQKSAPDAEQLHRQIEDGVNANKNNSHMIIKIAQRIDEVRDDLRKVSGKTDSFLEAGKEIDRLKNNVDQIAGKTNRIKANSQIIEKLKQDLGGMSRRMASVSSVNSELDAIKSAIDSIADKSSKIDSLGGVMDGLKRQFEAISSRADAASANVEYLKGMTGKIDRIESEIGALAQRADATAFVGEGLKSVQDDLLDFKRDVSDKTGNIEQKISSVSDILKRQGESVIEFHKKSDRVFSELRSVKGAAGKASGDSSKEMMALLRLSEYQSTVRMLAESKYGGPKDLEAMASQTADIANLFDGVSASTGREVPLPREVMRWAVGKILDCADRWEIRFADAYSVLTNAIGRDMLKESIRIQQVRDIYGIRAVDEIRGDLKAS